MFERFFSRNKKQAEIPGKILREMSPPPIRHKKKILIKRRYLLDNRGDRAMLLEELPFTEADRRRQPIQKQQFSNENTFVKEKPKQQGSWEKILDENKLLQQIIGYQKEKNLELESIIGEIEDNNKIVRKKNNPIRQTEKKTSESKEDEAMEINFYMVSTNEELEKKLKIRREEGNVILNVNDVHIVINNKSKSHFPVVGWA